MRTPAAAECLDAIDVAIVVFVTRYHESRGYGPSQREVAQAVDRGTAVTNARLHRLREKQWLAFEPGTVGTMRPLVTTVEEFNARLAEGGRSLGMADVDAALDLRTDA